MLTHQLHSVENANRRERVGGALRDVALSTPYHEYTSQDIGKRATVVPIRDFEYKVPHKLDDPAYEPQFNDDPDNILGPVIEGMIPVVTSQDPASLFAAFNKRCNFMQAGPKDEIADTEFKQALKLIDSLPAIHEPWQENDTDRLRWLAKFDENKQKKMVEAWSSIADADKRSVGRKTLMVKIETLLKRDDDSWAPRAIYVGSDEHNALTGPAMMVAMERLVKQLDTDEHGSQLGPCDIKFAYKMDDVSLCEHLLSDPLCQNGLEGDYSRNDREQRSRVAYIVDAWLRKLGFDEYTRQWMLESSEEYEVYAPLCGLKATLKHQLPTGTTATTFRNSAFNATMFAVSMMQQKITRARALILGDDLLAATAQTVNLVEWQNCVDRFKMVLKAASPQLNGQATFLSRRLISTSLKPCLVPKIGKALARFNVRATKNPSISDDAYMAGKALAHAYEFRHVPQFVKFFLQRFNIHFHRANLSQDAFITHDSWFLKISGLETPAQILNAIMSEPNKVDDDTLGYWLCETYDEDWYSFKELFTVFILGTEYEVIDTPMFDILSIDF